MNDTAPFDCEVAIAGAGPAGIATALALVKREPGLAGRIVVIDRARFPRDKPCGGGLTGHAALAMAALDLPPPTAHIPAAHALVKYGAYERQVALRAPVSVIRRWDFDHALVETASARGVEVRQGSAVAILSYGTRLGEALAAAEKLAAFGLTPTVADARFMKPLDEELIARLASSHDVLLTVEEGGIGGFGSHVATFLAGNGLLDGKLRFRPLMIPDVFTEQASQNDMYAQAGLDRAGIVATALAALGISDTPAIVKK